MKAFLTCTSVALLALGVSAAHATTINATQIGDGAGPKVVGDATFTASANFEHKTQDGYTGVGVAGGTAGEIDIGETITGNFSGGAKLFSSITFGLLFDGPEYGDVNEKAIVTIDGNKTGTLVATGATTAVWTFGATTFNATNISAATDGSGAVWRVDNPFGATTTSSIVFGAATGYCNGDAKKGACNNQSDYDLIQLVYTTPGTTQQSVPEPTSLGLLAAGMIGLGIARRRSRKS